VGVDRSSGGTSTEVKWVYNNKPGRTKRPTCLTSKDKKTGGIVEGGTRPVALKCECEVANINYIIDPETSAHPNYLFWVSNRNHHRDVYIFQCILGPGMEIFTTRIWGVHSASSDSQERKDPVLTSGAFTHQEYNLVV